MSARRDATRQMTVSDLAFAAALLRRGRRAEDDGQPLGASTGDAG